MHVADEHPEPKTYLDDIYAIPWCNLVDGTDPVMA